MAIFNSYVCLPEGTPFVDQSRNGETQGWNRILTVDGCEILHQLLDGLSHCNSHSLQSLIDTNGYQLAQEFVYQFLHPHSVCVPKGSLSPSRLNPRHTSPH